MTAEVELRGVRHRFGEVTALDGVELRIDAGRFAVLLGPSGCGKTTLLSILGGFLHPGEGSVHIGGVDVTRLPPARRPTTTMFQDYALFPHMRVVDNVGFGLRMRGWSRAARRERAGRMLELVGLAGSGDRKPHQLSGGQRQRVALARALAVEPDVLLLDEPLGALDIQLRRQMQAELKTIQQRVGTTFVHVTHDQEEALAIADRIVVMNAGRIEDAGPPEQVYLRPGSLFSAAFMGEANLLPARLLAADAAGVLVDSALGRMSLPADALGRAGLTVAGAPVKLCFRPEHLRAEHGGDAPALHRLGAATVLESAFFGTHYRCRLRAEGGRQTELIAHLPPSPAPRRGRRLSLTLELEAVTVLAAAD